MPPTAVGNLLYTSFFPFSDCTAEYIQGSFGNVDHNIDVNGLKCVTVLIGVYNKLTGFPVMGVINRPFIDDW